MMPLLARYLPAGLMAAGGVVSMLAGTPQATQLVRPLDAALPATFLGQPFTRIPISPEEVKASGVTDWVNRSYTLPGSADSLGVQLYVGYHATQQGDNRMHSPSQCLPGGGWTPIESSVATVPIPGRAPVTVNRFVLQSGALRILTYYWFQGRGRVTSGQAELKLNALKDSFLHHRDEEALVRVIVPVPGGEGFDRPVGSTGLTPDSLAVRFASEVIPAMERALAPAP